MFVLKKILYYTFGKISNGILFIVLGFVSALAGVAYSAYVAIVVGSVLATLGVALAFVRESQYNDAMADIARLRIGQRKLKSSIDTLRGRVQLLGDDLSEAQKQISDLRAVKVVDLGNFKYVAGGKSGPAFTGRE